MIQSNVNKIDRELGFSVDGSASEFLGGGGNQVRDLDTEKVFSELPQKQESRAESVEFKDILDKKVFSSSDLKNSVMPPSDDEGVLKSAEEILKSGEGIKGSYFKFLDLNGIKDQDFTLEDKDKVSSFVDYGDTQNMKFHIGKNHDVKTQLLGLDLEEKSVNYVFGIVDESVNDELSVGTAGAESYLSFVLDIPSDYKIDEQFSLYLGDISEENDEGITLRMVPDLNDVLLEVEVEAKVEIGIPGSRIGDSSIVSQEFTEDFVNDMDSISDVEAGSLKGDGQIQSEGSLVTVSDQRPFLQSLSGGKFISDPTVSIRNALSTTGNTEIVRSAQFVLKNEGEGEIRLLLRPENLGVVHMRLNFGDGLVSGRIFVGNSYVQAAFEDNMPDLRDAMERAGLTLGEVEVSVDQGYSRHGSKENRNDFWDFDRIFLSQGYENTGLNLSYVQDSIERINSSNSVVIDLRA